MRSILTSFAILTLASCASGPMAGSDEVCASALQPPVASAESNPEIKPPVVLSRVDPQAHSSLTGSNVDAVVEAIVGEDGIPRNICVVSGDPIWGSDVAEAMRKWKLQPAMLDGKPVAARFELKTRFNGR